MTNGDVFARGERSRESGDDVSVVILLPPRRRKMLERVRLGVRQGRLKKVCLVFKNRICEKKKSESGKDVSRGELLYPIDLMYWRNGKGGAERKRNKLAFLVGGGECDLRNGRRFAGRCVVHM